MKKREFLIRRIVFILIIISIIGFISPRKNKFNYPIESSSQNSSGLESCTTISFHLGNKTLFAVNEATFNLDPVIIISEEGLIIGVMDEDGMNAGTIGILTNNGLFGDENRLPIIPMNVNLSSDNVTGDELGEILEISSNVSEFIHNIGGKNIFLWGEEYFGGQLHMADISGDGVVLSGNWDGDVVLTRKEISSNYLLTMNLNAADPSNTFCDYPCVSHEIAVEMLEEIETEEDLTVDSLVAVLDALHVEGETYETIFSYIIDPISKEIFCYYQHDYNVVFHWNYEEEIIPGEIVIYNIAQLYEEHQQFNMIFVLIMTVSIGIPSMLLIRYSLNLILKRKSRLENTNNQIIREEEI